MSKKEIKRLVILNIPYLILGLLATNLGQAWRLAEGTDISSPLFSSDGRTAGYLRQDGFYGCSIETGKEELLLNGALSFVPDGKEGFYASSRETGIVRVHMGREQEEVWKPEPLIRPGFLSGRMFCQVPCAQTELVRLSMIRCPAL